MTEIVYNKLLVFLIFVVVVFLIFVVIGDLEFWKS